MSSETDGSPFRTGPGEVWDTAALVKWTNDVRTCLGTGSSLTDEQMEVVSTLLKRLLDDEKRGNPPSLRFIAKTRFDLLVRDILSFGTNHRDQRASLQTMEMQCFALQRVWRKHFKLSAFVSMIEEERQRKMEETSLKDIELDPISGKWVVEDAMPESYSQGEGSLHFEPGQWWLNLACCYRDGIIGHMLDDMTKGPYGVTAIPLLAGEELESSIPDCFIYRRTGPIQDMYISIMSEVGRRNVRILRGYKLKSPYAPKGGIRYDGLYTPMEYSHKLNIATNMYEVRLLFRRNWGTPAVETLLNIPSPSQLDEWKMYLLTAANEREISRSPNRVRLIPQGKEPKSSALLTSSEFRQALKTEDPSSSLMPPDPSTPSPDPRKKRDGVLIASAALNEVLDLGEKASSPSPPTSTHTLSPEPRGRKRMRMDRQGNEERRGLLRSSDLIDMLNEGPESSSSSVNEPPAPRTPLKPSASRKKMIPQGNEERGSFMRSSDFMDFLNEGPDEASSSSVKSSPASVKGKTSVRDSGIGGMNDDVLFNDKEKGGANQPPMPVKKRVKGMDPYDIDAMMQEIVKAENEEEEENDGSPSRKGAKS